MEFDHAINYVTRIKKRFANDPATYKHFLDILHTYQRQQRSIKDVLERVSLLFADHPDLLRDFTYFLPDSVQEQARDRIQRTLAEAKGRRDTGLREEVRKRDSMAEEMMEQGSPGGGYGRGGGGGGAEAGGRPYAGPLARDRERAREADRADAREYVERAIDDRELSLRERERDRERERMIDRARDRGQVGMGPGKSPRTQVVVKKRREKESDGHVTGLTPTERSFFDRVKSVIGFRDQWVEFLKILELFSSESLTRAELFQLISDVLPQSGVQRKSILDELKTMVSNKGFTDMTQQDIWYSMPIAEVDFSQCAKCTPSYRHIPNGYPKLACSDRSKTEAEVLNGEFYFCLAMMMRVDFRGNVCVCVVASG